jgi:hypothetical protein
VRGEEHPGEEDGADDPALRREARRDATAIERLERDQVEEVQEEPCLREGEPVVLARDEADRGASKARRGPASGPP